MHTLKQIRRFFGDHVITYHFCEDITICFRVVLKNILTEKWYDNKEKDESAEKIRVVKTVGKLVHEKIKSKFFDLDGYSAPNCFLEDVEIDIATPLKLDYYKKKNPKPRILH